jgi:acid stress-induced BolA-like protein IbaG/YrbA
MVTPQESMLKQVLHHILGIACDHCQVSGDGQHFEAVIVSAKPSTARTASAAPGRLRALGDRMREEIHALSMKTLTPAEWKA